MLDESWARSGCWYPWLKSETFWNPNSIPSLRIQRGGWVGKTPQDLEGPEAKEGLWRGLQRLGDERSEGSGELRGGSPQRDGHRPGGPVREGGGSSSHRTLDVTWCVSMQPGQEERHWTPNTLSDSTSLCRWPQQARPQGPGSCGPKRSSALCSPACAPGAGRRSRGPSEPALATPARLGPGGTCKLQRSPQPEAGEAASGGGSLFADVGRKTSAGEAGVATGAVLTQLKPGVFTRKEETEAFPRWRNRISSGSAGPRRRFNPQPGTVC
ncbi:uncharacterized protein LOC125114950 isoform X2 [Phacochoerus africanus]|uniref:uncharacterized protein LOC125114950 isoform X2 n=1 Tax=Phacochoerus africanus TaxID=41426 RepID=UPI001FD99583|nr:uncharacterized protein LOC125114950 isoform X2 [Phacochoerus africanus]